VRHPKRDTLQKFLQDEGIGTLIHYPIPPHLQQAYRYLGYGVGKFPIAEGMAAQVLSLPMSPQMNDASVEAVIATLNAGSHE
jgi:dTDP-4-amino-4,6-dideoxygalactose transaminase